MFQEIRTDNESHERVLPEELYHLAVKDERLQISLLDDIQHKAASELLAWIQGKEGRLPRIFSEEDGKILRLLYRGRRKPSTLAKDLGISQEEAKKQIENIKSKVLLFVAVDPWT
jgi:hypothetical protein